MKGKVAPFVKQFYPQYYTIEEYPASQCAPFRKVADKWGAFSNFGTTPLVVEGIEFSCVEKLFQCIKFCNNPEAVRDIYSASGQTVKMKAKKWDKAGATRDDWGQILVDAMKFCLNLKYEQVDSLRKAFTESSGLFIVEDQTTFGAKQANTWGCKLVGDKYIGPNLMGRLLMELRDNGLFDVQPPSGMDHLINIIKCMGE